VDTNRHQRRRRRRRHEGTADRRRGRARRARSNPVELDSARRRRRLLLVGDDEGRNAGGRLDGAHDGQTRRAGDSSARGRVLPAPRDRGRPEGHKTRTDTSFYGLGQGYTAERFDHNRITLEPERKTWKPGERRDHGSVAGIATAP
jgi:hypothetical protein